MSTETLAQWVRAARTAKGLSQTQLGEALSVTKANVSHWETGKHEPSFGQLLRIRDVTGHALHDVGPAPDWPFPKVPRERLTSLSPAQLIAVQFGILGVLAALAQQPMPAQKQHHLAA